VRTREKSLVEICPFLSDRLIIFIRVEELPAFRIFEVNEVFDFIPRSLITIDTSGSAFAVSAIKSRQIVGIEILQEIFMSVSGTKDYFALSDLVDYLLQLSFPDILEEKRDIEDIERVEDAWEESLDFKSELFVDTHKLLTPQVLNLQSLQIHQNLNLVHSLFEHYISTLLELYSPCVF
jgi:hypothetical protein